MSVVGLVLLDAREVRARSGRENDKENENEWPERTKLRLQLKLCREFVAR